MLAGFTAQARLRQPVAIETVVIWQHVVDKYLVMQGVEIADDGLADGMDFSIGEPDSVAMEKEA